MSRRTVKAYNKVFAELKELNPKFHPAVAVTDFEKGLGRSLRESFPKIKLFGCQFHFSQVSKYYDIHFLNSEAKYFLNLFQL